MNKEMFEKEVNKISKIQDKIDFILSFKNPIVQGLLFPIGDILVRYTGKRLTNLMDEKNFKSLLSEHLNKI